MNSYNPRSFEVRVRRLEQERRAVPTTEYLKPLARTLTSQSLFHGEREIGIEHHGALYRLKITRQGKLILNK
jgi:hemin uptake protein HemP